MTNILILGGTGAMGKFLVEVLQHKHENNIVVTTRSTCHLDEENVKYIVGDAHNPQFIYPLLKLYDWDAIIDFMFYGTQEFDSRIAHLLSATKQYVFLSSSRVYADNNALITEDSPRLLDTCHDDYYLKSDEYALAKARQEDLLHGSGKNNWTIIRPYITFSENRLQLGPLEKEGWLYRALQGRTIIFSEDIAKKFTTLTYGKDVARGIESIIGKSKALGETFHITNQKSLSWDEILNVYISVFEEKIGYRPKIIMKRHWEPYIGGGKAQVLYDRLFNRRFDNSKISSFIDCNTFSDTKSTLANCLKTFLEHPTFKPINWTAEARKDRISKEWTNLSEIKDFKSIVKYLIVRLNLHK